MTPHPHWLRAAADGVFLQAVRLGAGVQVAPRYAQVACMEVYAMTWMASVCAPLDSPEPAANRVRRRVTLLKLWSGVWTWRMPGFPGRDPYTHTRFPACREGRFGQSCQEQCLGTSGCRGLFFCLPDPYGCSCGSGWRGSRCQEGMTQPALTLHSGLTC